MKYLLDNNPAMKAAKERYDYFIADKKARIAYQQREKFLRDQANYIYTARMEGHAEGHAEGIEQGKHDQAIESARKLRNMGLSPEQIVEATGLTAEEISRL